MRSIRGEYLLGLALLLVSSLVSAETPPVGGERCFGAVGDNCAVRNTIGIQEGYCIGTKCPISGGSWEHDECCWKKTV